MAYYEQNLYQSPYQLNQLQSQAFGGNTTFGGPQLQRYTPNPYAAAPSAGAAIGGAAAPNPYARTATAGNALGYAAAPAAGNAQYGNALGNAGAVAAGGGYAAAPRPVVNPGLAASQTAGANAAAAAQNAAPQRPAAPPGQMASQNAGNAAAAQAANSGQAQAEIMRRRQAAAFGSAGAALGGAALGG